MEDNNMENWDFNNISQEERARIREEIDRELETCVNEELTIADELSKAANNIIILIKNDIKKMNFSPTKEDCVFCKMGEVKYECFNKTIITRYKYYNFLNNSCYKNCRKSFPQINRNNNINIIEIVICAISGHIIETTLYDTVYHELEHIFQQTKANKMFTKPEIYDFAVKRKREVDVVSPEFIICDSIYLTYNFERDAYINGAYGYLLHTCKSYLDVDKMVRNTDLYEAVEQLKFYYAIIYQNKNKFIETLSLPSYRKFGMSVNDLLKRIKQSIDSYETKITKMKKKTKKDIANKNGEHIMETKKDYSFKEIREILIERFDRIE